MKTGWIYPHQERCGIARYARDYADALRPHGELVDIDPLQWITNRRAFIDSIGGCDVVHVQYDTAAYRWRQRDFYSAMARSVKAPLVVSLHEVYEEDPAAFPRSRITGHFPLLQTKRAMWDLRHPVQCAFERHCAGSFHAAAVLVHQQYHADIIAKKGCAPQVIRVEALPVKRCGTWREFIIAGLPAVRLGAFGFVNPLYDYELLFTALKQLQRPWTFTWIGGIRSTAQQPLLDVLARRIAEENWSDRFHITGWITEEELPSRFADIDIVLALFINRSSSASLASALGAGKPVIAASIPLTREISSANDPAGAPPPLLLTEHDAAGIINAIEHLCTDANHRAALYNGLQTYCYAASFETMATRLRAIYRELSTA